MKGKYSIRYTYVLIAGISALMPLASYAQPKDAHAQYERAVAYYEKQKYRYALELLDKVIPALKGTQEEASAIFYQAYSFFHQKKYLLSASRFKHFRSTFTRDPRAEEAMYMQGRAMFAATLDLKLDQTKTYRALSVLEEYLQEYPEGNYCHQAAENHQILTNKLAQKEFMIAKLYYDLGHYRAADVTLQNLLDQYPRAVFSEQEQAAYLQVMALGHCVANQEAIEAVKKAIEKFMQYYHSFADQYPESSYLKDLKESYNAVALIANTHNLQLL